MAPDTTLERLARLEDFRGRTERRMSDVEVAVASIREDDLKPLQEFQAESRGARRVYMLMWGVLCSAVVMDLGAQAFIYRQQSKNAEDIRGIQDSQQLILSIIKGEYHAK